ncbi:TVP38/TMEM64 family protein [Robertkochia aurantiaca]|uniref:TVP38/TMEM64 family protein n=1 Tax=Robertkochia aurantiaca TaxID=2873700 RepID=UPI001CC9BF4F|nr:TVP38/TMEM64 family protein [Robertkochia sp. 3YJGBD-33]
MKRFPLYISGGLLLLSVIAWFLSPEFQTFVNQGWDVLKSGEPSQIKDWITSFGWLAPLLIIILMIVQMFLIVIPSVGLMVVSILSYGPYWGSVLAIFAVFAASTVGYFAGRYVGPSIMEKFLGGNKEQKLEGFLKDYGFWAVFITRLNPLLSNDTISFVAGILGIDYFTFILATVAGTTPLTIAIAVLGETSDSFEEGMLWGSVAMFLLLLIHYLWKRFFRN